MDLDKITKIISELECERDWRQKDFKNIKLIYLTLKNEEDFLKIFKSMCIPIIYAHFEGFCVSSFKIIVNYINSLKIEYHKLNNNIFTFSKSETYNYLKGKQSFKQQCQFSDNFVKTLLTKQVIIPHSFNTKSNINYSVLEEICDLLALENKFNSYEKDIDMLLNKRNKIAHGENGIGVEEEDILKFIKIVIEIFDDFINSYNDYLLHEKYLK